MIVLVVVYGVLSLLGVFAGAVLGAVGFEAGNKATVDRLYRKLAVAENERDAALRRLDRWRAGSLRAPEPVPTHRIGAEPSEAARGRMTGAFGG